MSNVAGATAPSPASGAPLLHIAVLGLGLIGGSAAQAWRNRGHRITGWSRRAETVSLAAIRGIIDDGANSAASAVHGADVVVLAPPVLAMREVLRAIAPKLRTGAIVTDVASTKQAPERWASELLPAHTHWVGAHPMAGKELSGLSHVDPDLFRGRTWVVVPPPGASRDAVSTVERLGQELGSRIIEMDAASHDEAVAYVSHLPFMVSTALSAAVIGSERFVAWSAVAASGLRDMTRLASGDALMHRDICATNRDQIAGAMERFAAAFATMAAQVRALPDDHKLSAADNLEDLGSTFERVKADRDAWLPHAR